MLLCGALLCADRSPAAPIDLGDLDAGGRTTTPAPSYGVDMPELAAAREAFRKGRLSDCRELLEAACEKNRALPPADLMLSRFFLASQKVDAAKALMEKVAAKHPGNPEVYLLFGHLALAEKRWTDAQLHFEKSLMLGVPEGWSSEQQRRLWSEAFAGQSFVAEQREDWATAQAALSQWMKAEPGNPGLRDRLGVALFMLGRQQEAFDQFQTAARQDPRMNPAEVSLAVMHARKGDFDMAR
ncbi:MAG: tetratricopeptide repeat protein, partial [Planctomycetales bacterium]|nr:tetratricopeptide repeat protein [Planctomycetales bacterium]